MNETETAWLAGLYEGEGCLHRLKHKNGWQLSVAMTDGDVVGRCLELTGVGTVNRIDRAARGWKDVYMWRTNRRGEIAAVLTAILPHLGRRRLEAAEQFFEWYDGGCPSSMTDADRAAEAARMRRSRARRRGQPSPPSGSPA